jgi:two-component system sensor histidine kinase RegB
MVDFLNLDLGRRSRRLRVDTLVTLRWIALSGQIIALIVTHFVYRFSVPLASASIVIAASAGLNLGLRLSFRRTDRLQDVPAASILGYDILQLTALLYFTGGIENPFAMLYLAPITISAVSLAGPITLGLTLLVVACVTIVTFWHYPVPWFVGEQLALPLLYRAGIWFAVVISAVFIAVYASRVAREARRLADALAATELVTAREQHLNQLDGLAAAAAHELGTPLATITLVVKDLENQLGTGPYEEDLSLLGQEVARCRAILKTLTSLGADDGGILDDLSLSLLLEEVVGPHRDFGVEIEISKRGHGREPICRRNPALSYGLGNLIENATDFARSKVEIVAQWNGREVIVTIEDDGPGFPSDVVERVGDPYVTTRKNRRTKTDEGSGLGLGLFIAKTLLERSGATVRAANRVPPLHGATITISWPRTAFEHSRVAVSGAA